MTADEIRKIENNELRDGTFVVLREMCAQLAELNLLFRSIVYNLHTDKMPQGVHAILTAKAVDVERNR
jgi:hypothetical protein